MKGNSSVRGPRLECRVLSAEEDRFMPLYRSRRSSIIAGVCGGIAEWLGWSPTWVRILYILVSIISVAFPGMIAYVILWLVMPKSPEP